MAAKKKTTTKRALKTTGGRQRKPRSADRLKELEARIRKLEAAYAASVTFALTEAANLPLKLSMPSGSVGTDGDIYRYGGPVVVPGVSVRATKSKELELPPGDYFYKFNVSSGTGAYQLEVENRTTGVSMNKDSFSAPPNMFQTFNFTVS